MYIKKNTKIYSQKPVHVGYLEVEEEDSKRKKIQGKKKKHKIGKYTW